MNLLQQIVDHPRFATRQSEYLRWYPKTLSPVRHEPAWVAGRLRGAYIHVPFCDQLCRFCPFNKVVTREETVSRFVRALVTEIDLLAPRVAGGPLAFVYFGGGTPSVLTPAQISDILDALERAWGIRQQAEITLETHPTHAHEPRLRATVRAGVTRVSMGIQSFDQPLLTALGATHAEVDSRRAVDAARATLDNVAIDLLYGYAAQSPDDWARDLRLALETYRVPHISCYALVPVGPTAPEVVPEVDEVRLALQALEAAQRAGLAHYASCASGGFDVAPPGGECRYEMEHWQAPQQEFVGLGPGAFGFAAGHSTTNRLSVQRYCEALEHRGLPLASAVPVSEAELRRRYFVIGVKTLHVPFAPYRERFERDPRADFGQTLAELEADGLARIEGDGLTLTPVGRLYVDTCSTAFFSDSERDVPHPEEPEIREVERLLAVVG